MTWLQSKQWDDLPANIRSEWVDKANYLVNNNYRSGDAYELAKLMYERNIRKQNGNNKPS